MAGINDRIRKLEQRQQGPEVDERRERLYARLYHGHQNHQRELRGLEPLPLPDELRETKSDIMEVLAETIPAYRAEPGWQDGEGKAFLDRWEDDLLERLSELEREEQS